MTDTRKLTLTVEEAGQLLGIGRASAYEAARTGQIPTIRVGRRLIVPKAALNRMLGENATSQDGQSPEHPWRWPDEGGQK